MHQAQSIDIADDFIITHRDSLEKAKVFVAGRIAGAVSKSVMAPLSRCCTLMQVQSMRPNKFHGVGPNNTHLVESLQKIVQEEGFRALWKGNGAAVLHRIPYCGTSFVVVNEVKKWMGHLGLPDAMLSAVAGGLGAILGITLCYPLDVIKTRLMTQTKTAHYLGIRHCAWTCLKEEGPRVFTKGLGTTLFALIPSVSLNFMIFDSLSQNYPSDNPGIFLLYGGLSGTVSTVAVFPLDLVRKQLQMTGLHGRPAHFRGPLSCIRHIWRTDGGIRGFYRGVVPEIFKVSPTVALMFGLQRYLNSLDWPFE